MDATDSQRSSAARGGRFWLSLAILAAVAFAYVLLVSPSSRRPSGTSGPAIGRRLTYLRLEGLTGASQAVSLDDLQGHVSVVNYWGTWCVPCLREFPHVVALSEK